MKQRDREHQLRMAQRAILDEIGEASWLRGVGIGLVGDSPGIVVSVAADGVRNAEALVDSLHLEVPVTVRVLGPVRKRPLKRASH